MKFFIKNSVCLGILQKTFHFVEHPWIKACCGSPSREVFKFMSICVYVNMVTTCTCTKMLEDNNNPLLTNSTSKHGGLLCPDSCCTTLRYLKVIHCVCTVHLWCVINLNVWDFDLPLKPILRHILKFARSDD
jgi:hypothetical protein